MICITNDQLRAALTEMEDKHRAKPESERQADAEHWINQPVPVTVEAQAEYLMEHLKKHGAQQKID